jgi:hypothetical protein
MRDAKFLDRNVRMQNSTCIVELPIAKYPPTTQGVFSVIENPGWLFEAKKGIRDEARLCFIG